MNDDIEELSRMAAVALHVNGLLLGAQEALRHRDIETALEKIAEAQQQNWENEKALIRAGAADPIDRRIAELRLEMSEEEERTIPRADEVERGPMGL